MNTSHKRGFTLIELLVVIAIIGVLAGVVLTSLGTARQKARDTQRISNVKSIELALELYADAHSGAYPTATATCDATHFYGLEALKTGGYLPQVPTDASRETPCFPYSTNTVSGSVTKYHIGAILEATNTVLTTDADGSSAAYDNGSKFDGTSVACTSTAGTAATASAAGTELCYDIAN